MPRFTLRDLFWLTLVVGMGVGWWLEHDQSNKQRSKVALLEGLFRIKDFSVIWRNDGLPETRLSILDKSPVGQP